MAQLVAASRCKPADGSHAATGLFSPWPWTQGFTRQPPYCKPDFKHRPRMIMDCKFNQSDKGVHRELKCGGGVGLGAWGSTPPHLILWKLLDGINAAHAPAWYLWGIPGAPF